MRSLRLEFQGFPDGGEVLAGGLGGGGEGEADGVAAEAHQRKGRHPWEGLMEERKGFAYPPPYSRIIDIDIEDGNPKRLVLMSRLLAEELNRALCPTVGIGGPVRVEGPYERSDHGRTLRVILVKDRQFPERKKRLHEAVASFTRERKYVGFIHLDVDPE